MPDTLFLRLEGPLQSWGERGRWSVRDTAPEPTKSGVIGLMACALGYREDEQIRPLSQKTRMGVRIDAPGRIITDYHTIGGGYSTPTLLTAEGKPKKSPSGQPHTELSNRDYLCQASFLVALQIRETSDQPLIDQMAHALQNPVWPLFLGRKSCPPTIPVFAGVGDYQGDLKAALIGHQTFTHYTKLGVLNLALVLEQETQTGSRKRDNIFSRRYRVFHPRYTEQSSYKFSIQKEGDHVSVQIATQQ